MGVLAERRRCFILDRVRRAGQVRIADVMREFDVADMTVRRDLESMAKMGLIRKTYGGAVAAGAPEIDESVRYRRTQNLKAKRIVGELAAERLVADGDVIYLEAGSTCFEIIPFLADYKELTIIVNSLYLMTRLGEMAQHKVILVGGEYRAERMDLIGAISESVMGELGGFKAFTSADDISIEGGISGAEVATVTFTKLVLQRAAKVYFVGDHAKFDNPALYKIADIDRLDGIVTDRRPSEKWIDAASRFEIEMIYPMDDKAGD